VLALLALLNAIESQTAMASNPGASTRVPSATLEGTRHEHPDSQLLLGAGSSALNLAWYRTPTSPAPLIVNSLGTYTADPDQGIHLVGDGCAFSACLGYAAEPGGEPSTLLGGHQQVVDQLDPYATPIVEGFSLREIAGDIDGDGVNDLLLDRMYLLMDPVEPTLVDYPNGVFLDDHAYLGPRAVGDLDGDGYADLFDAQRDTIGWAWDELIGPVTASIYPGGPDGFAQEPLWSLTFDRAVGSPLQLQVDGDPELELLVVLGQYEIVGYGESSYPYDLLTAIIDDAHTADPVVRLGTTLPASATYSQLMPPLHRLGDLDGDGADEVLIAVPDRRWPEDNPSYLPTTDLQVLSSTTDYDLHQPAMSLRLDYPDGNDRTKYLLVLVVDADRDGHLDVVATQASFEAMMQVWFGPLLPEPVVTPKTDDSGATADTGAATTMPTTTGAGTSDTGGAPDVTGSNEPGTSTSPASADAGRCGCAVSPAGGGLGGGLLLLGGLVGWRRSTRRCE
jgi:MYXO-CTERM domain-containing protein